MRLRGRLALAMVGTSLAAVLLVSLVGAGLSARFLEEASLGDLRRQAQLAAVLVEAANDARGGAVPPRQQAAVVERTLAQADVRVVVAPSDRLPPAVATLLGDDGQRQLDGGRRAEGIGELEGRRFAWVAFPTGDRRVVTFRPVAGLREASGEVARRLFLAGLLGVAAAGALGLWLGSRFARPVLEVEQVVEGVADGDLSRRVPADVTARRDELGELGRGVDAMAASLQDARKEQQVFFRSVAHELRTPLTNIRGYAEGVVDGHWDGREHHAAEVIHDEALRLQRLVEDVMTLARLDVGQLDLEPQQLDAADVVALAARAAAPAAEAAGVRLVVESRPTPARTDAGRLRQVVDNLLANAIRVVPSGGVVRLVVGPRPNGGIHLVVSDSGPGLDDDAVAVAFERYALWRRYRGEREVGTGLGLAIVAEVVRRLGGTARVEGHGPDGGARFTVALPPDVPRWQV